MGRGVGVGRGSADNTLSSLLSDIKFLTGPQKIPRRMFSGTSQAVSLMWLIQLMWLHTHMHLVGNNSTYT